MQIKKLLLGLLLTFCNAHTYAQAKQYKVVNIGFYNLENFYDTLHQEGVNDYEFLPSGKKRYTGAVYLEKANHLASVIHDMGTNISPEGLTVLGVSEIETRGVLEELTNNPLLKDRHYQIVHYNSPDVRGVDVGLLYNPAHFTVIDSRPLHVDLPPDPDGYRHKTRDVLWVKGSLDGQIMHIFVNHWPSRLGGEAASAPNRAAAATVCRKMIDSIYQQEPDANVVVMGDLNDNPTNESITKVLKAGGNPEKLKAQELYNPWVAYYNKGIGTLAYQDAWALFDQIMVSQHLLEKKDDQFHFYKANIFKRDDMIQSSGKYKGYPKRTYDFDNYAGGFSDHFPTFITFIKAL
ncbi:endonuclease/exonuclease/phosphatase [Chitinophaga sp. 30R24]|uniref:endonuclease/exonuclease/phosphatase family protein n=1 Tax=Chitinophaga sp. 30R24 TaxID=3248838 RepID=UPI003B9090C5